MKPYKLRFNLGRGENYMKWKLTYPSGKAHYFDPALFTIIMRGATLKNNRKTAEKIFAGANKTVCSWVSASNVLVVPHDMPYTGEQYDKEILSYNPRVAPHWRDEEGKDIDGESFEYLVADKGSLFSLTFKNKFNHDWNQHY